MIGHHDNRVTDPGWSLEPGEAWRMEAACANTDLNLFFPDQGAAEQNRAAKLVCSRCPVRRPCLEAAMTTTSANGGDVPYSLRYGIWGGMSERERSGLAKAGWAAGDPLPPIVGVRWRGRCENCHHDFADIDRHRARCAARAAA